MKLTGKLGFLSFGRQRARDREINRIKSESRARVAELATQGRGVEALNENLRLLGIDGEAIQNGAARPKLVDFEIT